MDAPGLVGHRPGPARAPHGLGGGQAGLERILVEAVPEVGAAEPGPPHALQGPEAPLRLDGGGVVERMLVGDLGNQALD